MVLERERRFLLKPECEIPINLENCFFLKQGYFLAEFEDQLRIRLTYHDSPIYYGDKRLVGATMAYKKHVNPTDREEHEWDIHHLGQAVLEDMYKTTKWKVEKTRAIIDRWELDMYKLPNGKTLYVAEIEYSDDNPFPDELPDWVGEEITGKYEFTNIHLAKQFSSFT